MGSSSLRDDVALAGACTVYPKKYAHGFVVLCFVVVMQSFIMNSHEVFIHIHQGCFAGTGAIVRLPQCQWSKPDGYGKISQCITTTKHSKAKTVCIFLGIYCMQGACCPAAFDDLDSVALSKLCAAADILSLWWWSHTWKDRFILDTRSSWWPGWTSCTQLRHVGVCTGTFKWIHFICLKTWIVFHRHCARMNKLHPHQTRRSTGTVKWIHFLCLKAWIVFHRHCVRMKICTHLGHVGQPKLSNEFASYVLKLR